MVGEEVGRARFLIVLFVSLSLIAILGLAWGTVRYTSEEHTVEPEAVTLEPGDWIEIPISPQFEWYEVRFHLEMDCVEELDIVVVHGTHGVQDEAMARHYNNRSVNDPDYGSTVMSSGDWREHIILECDCGCRMIIDNTPAGRVDQTDEPVRVGYDLRWTEHRSELSTLPFVLLVLVAISMPIGTVILWRRYDRAKVLDGIAGGHGEDGPRV